MQHFGKIGDVEVAITQHALTRLCEMELSADEIKKILLEPDETYTSEKYPNSPCYRRGDYSLGTVMEDGVLVVTTALYATRKAWLKASLEGKLPEDREYKLHTKIPTW